MSKIAKLVAALFVLASLMGAKCAKVDSNRPPEDRQVDPKRERVVQIRANSDAPYTVLVIATEAGKGGVDRTGPEHVAGGQYRQTLSYTSGLRIQVKMSVTGNAGDRFECQLVDGLDNQDHQRGQGKVVCAITTQR